MFDDLKITNIFQVNLMILSKIKHLYFLRLNENDTFTLNLQ